VINANLVAKKKLYANLQVQVQDKIANQSSASCSQTVPSRAISS